MHYTISPADKKDRKEYRIFTAIPEKQILSILSYLPFSALILLRGGVCLAILISPSSVGRGKEAEVKHVVG